MAKKKGTQSETPSGSNADSDGLQWQEVERGYALALAEGKVICRNPAGKRLATIPPWLKETEAMEQLAALRDWLEDHALECQHTIERWMLRSLAVPREILQQVWPDPDWRAAIENLVIATIDTSGDVDAHHMGLLRDVHETKGLGIVDADGESHWLKQSQIIVPHPILIDDLTGFRELASELGLKQVVDQLYRPVYPLLETHKELRAIDEFAGGKFDQLNFALGACRRLGYPVRGGYATCRVWEGETPLEARYYVGAESPEAETETGELIFVGPDQSAVPLGRVGQVTFSEGMRMAAAIYAKRKVEEQKE